MKEVRVQNLSIDLIVRGNINDKINGNSLSLKDVVLVSRHYKPVGLDPSAIEELKIKKLCGKDPPR